MRIVLARASEPTTILMRETCETPALEGPERTIALLTEHIDVCLRKLGISRASLAALGCTVPGVTDASSGTALFVSNLKGWDGYPIGQRLSEQLGVPVAVENDVNAAAYGEYEYGSGGACHSIVYLTVSTGIAAGIVVEGKLLRGFNHAAGELGFFVPDREFLDEDWHPNGCLELKSGGIGLAQRWSQMNGRAGAFTTARDVFEAAQAGHPQAESIIHEAADYLAQAAVAISAIIDPERIVLGGSIAQHQPVIMERVVDVLRRTMPHDPAVHYSSFEGDAPIVGALALAGRLVHTNIDQ